MYIVGRLGPLWLAGGPHYMDKQEYGDEPAEICTFVVRIWLEQGGKHGWRGHVTHVLSGERVHFESVEVMDAFVVGRVAEMLGCHRSGQNRRKI